MGVDFFLKLDKQRADLIAMLKRDSPLFPETLLYFKSDILYASTIVEFENNGNKFMRHHVESSMVCLSSELEKVKDLLLKKLNHSCKMTLSQGIPCAIDDIVKV